MKKVLITVLFVGFITQMNAQELGLRFGDVTGGNFAIDAVLPIGESNRIHADISYGSGVGADVIWDFIIEPLDGESLYWYTGVGAYAFVGSPFGLGAVGEVGLEYRFNEVPLVIGLDWRPYLGILDNTDVGLDSFGFNLRWVL